MAEGSIPECGAQIAITKCQLCKINDLHCKCLTCEEYMCNGCTIAHERSRASRDHKLLSTKDAIENSAICDYKGTIEEIPTFPKPTIDVKVISKFTIKDKDLEAAVDDTRAWLGGYGCRDLLQVTSDGRVYNTLKTNFAINDMAITAAGELLVTKYGGRKVKKMTPKGKFTPVYRAGKGHETCGITVTNDNNIIVGLCVRSKYQRKLVKLSPSGKELQTIQYESVDGNTTVLQNAWGVSCNRNGDVIVIIGHHVVAVDETGRKRFVYKGIEQGLKESFDPKYTVTDKYSRILVSDDNNNAVHLLDSEGKLLHFILTDEHQLNWPRGMSIGKSGKLWVCSYGNDKVMVVEISK